MGIRLSIPRGVARRRWPLVGLLLALAFLGHDVAVAGDAHGAAGPPRGEHARPHADAPASEGVVPEHGAAEEAPTAGCDAAVCSPVTACGVGRVVAPDPDGNGHGARAAGAATVFAPVDDLAASPASRALAGPTQPPGVRRALLPVLRI